MFIGPLLGAGHCTKDFAWITMFASQVYLMVFNNYVVFYRTDYVIS